MILGGRILQQLLAFSVCLWLACASRLAWSQDGAIASFGDVQAKFFAGDYEACIEQAGEAVERGIWNDIWSRLLIQALLTTGEYQQACEVYESVAQKFAASIPLRMLAAEAYRYAGKHERGNTLLEQIPILVEAAPWRFSDRDNMLAIGRYLLDEGEDARAVLDGFYDRSLKLDPGFVQGHLAVAELALSKADYQEAVNALRKAVALRPEDPQIHHLLSRAWAPSDSEKATQSLQQALALNPRHVDSLLVAARNQIDQEAYDEAERVLERVLQVNPKEPRGWALKAAISHLLGEYGEEGEHRSQALSTWSTNPEVDYMIGQVLSRHYRFAESVAYQRRALRLDPGYIQARFQLAQDLLRLGASDEGWRIVDQVAEQDAYNVVAYNLKTLQSRLAEFETLEAPGLIVRMQSTEAQLYGSRVLALLSEARKVLEPKYDVKLEAPVIVEIFPQQSDFAIRTFGLPGGAGFLGVCFGNLVTANSPGSQGDSPSNWESVLWHEFCHVITLNKTKNRMPRWLSEGISVYEELNRDASWGQRMDPTYKKMLLGEDFVPLSQLSGAFLQPKTPMHLQFAYFESSLAVRYLIEEHGMPLMLRLLDSLGMGLPIEQAFAGLYGGKQELDDDFKRFVIETANAFAADAEFDRGDMPERATGVVLDEVIAKHPGRYPALQAKAAELIQQRQWNEALAIAERLQELYPDDVSESGGLGLKAAIGRLSENKELERKALTALTQYAGDDVPVLLRLIELQRGAENWQGLFVAAEKLLAVQPLIATGHEAQALAASRLGKPVDAVPGLRALLALEPIDEAKLRYDLAMAWFEAGRIDEARAEVLLALEEAPRYRDAHRLLLAIHRKATGEPEPVSQTQSIPALSFPRLNVAKPDEGLPPKP